MAMVAAFTGTKMIMGGFHEAMAQQHERMRQEVASMSAEEIAKGETMAADLAAKYPAVPQSEIMHTLRTARTVTGSFEEGTAPLEALTKLRVVAQAAQTNASPEEMQEEFDKLVKALEIAGVATDPKRLNAYIGDIAKALNAFGDQLKPEDYFQMLKFGRGASPKISVAVPDDHAGDFGNGVRRRECRYGARGLQSGGHRQSVHSCGSKRLRLYWVDFRRGHAADQDRRDHGHQARSPRQGLATRADRSQPLDR